MNQKINNSSTLHQSLPFENGKYSLPSSETANVKISVEKTGQTKKEVSPKKIRENSAKRISKATSSLQKTDIDGRNHSHSSALSAIPPSRQEIIAGIESIQSHLSVLTPQKEMEGILSSFLNYLSSPLPVHEEDRRDAALMHQWNDKLAGDLAKLQSYAVHIDSKDSLKDEINQIERRLTSGLDCFSEFGKYVTLTAKLEEAFELAADQRNEFPQHLNFSMDAYRLLVESMTKLEELSDETDPYTEWGKRLQRKCQYQIEQAQILLEELSEEIFNQLRAEVAESREHLSAAKNQGIKSSENLFKHLKDVYEQKLCVNVVDNEMKQIEKDLSEILKNHSLSLVSEKIQKDISSIASMRRVSSNAQRDSSAFVLFFLEQIKAADIKSHFESLKEKCLDSSANEQDLFQAEVELDVLEFLCSRSVLIKQKKPKLANYISNLGNQIKSFKQERSLFLSKTRLCETIRNNRPIVTSLKQQCIFEHRWYYRDTRYTGKLRLALFWWMMGLQFWDNYSKRFGNVINTIGRRDYKYHLARMKETVNQKSTVINRSTESTEYREHYQKALDEGADPDFLKMYDQFLNGELSIGLDIHPNSFSPPSENSPSESSFLPDLSEWMAKFIGTNPEIKEWGDASEWDKWAHFTIYPKMRDNFFGQVVDGFNYSTPSELSETSTPQENLHHQMYQVYQQVVNGKEVAKEKNAFGLILNEFSHYLFARRDSYLKPIEEVPLTTVPLGKEAAKQWQRDAEGLVRQVETHTPHDLGLEKSKWEGYRHIGEKAASTFEELYNHAPLETASKEIRMGWLYAVDSFQRLYRKEKEQVQAAMFADKWKEEISVEKLKAFIDSPTVASDRVLLEILQLNRPGTYRSDPLIISPAIDALIQQRLNLFKDSTLCSKDKQIEFCRDFFGNPEIAHRAVKEPTDFRFSPHFNFQFQLKILVDAFGRRSGHCTQAEACATHVPENRLVIEEAVQRFVGQLQQWNEDGIISIKEMQFAIDVTSPMIESLKAAATASLQKKMTETTVDLTHLQPESTVVTVSNTRPYHQINGKLITGNNLPPTESYHTSSIKTPYITNSILKDFDLMSVLRTLKDAIDEQANVKGKINYFPVENIVEDFVRHLPFISDLEVLLPKIPNIDASEAISLLKNIFLFYWSRTKAERTPDSISTLYSLKSFSVLVAKSQNLINEKYLEAHSYFNYLKSKSIIWNFFPFYSFMFSDPTITSNMRDLVYNSKFISSDALKSQYLKDHPRIKLLPQVLSDLDTINSFSSLFPLFSDLADINFAPSPFIKNLLKHFGTETVDHQPLAEKLAIETGSTYPTSIIIEMLSIIESQNNVSRRALRFFTKYVSRLGENDFQHLLMFTLAHPWANIQDRNKDSEDQKKLKWDFVPVNFRHKFTTFFSNALAYFDKKGDFKTVAFILKTYGSLLLPHSFGLGTSDFSVQDEIDKRLRKPKLTIDEQYEYNLAAVVIYNPSNGRLAGQEASSYAIANINVELAKEQLNSAPDSYQLKQLDRIRKKNIKNLYHTINDDSSILDTVFTEMHPGVPLPKWKKKKSNFELEPPLFTSEDGKIGIDIYHWMITHNGIKASSLPSGVSSHPKVKAFFGNIKIATKYQLVDQPCKAMYQVIGPGGHFYRLIQHLNDDVTIQIAFKGKWYEQTVEPITLFNQIPQSLLDANHVWHITPTSEVLLTNKATGKAAFVSNAQKLYVLDNAEELSSTVLARSQQQPIGTLNKFEDPSNLILLHHDITRLISNIQIPRYEMELVVEQKNDKQYFVSPQYPGFHVAESQYLSAFSTFSRFLIFEKKEEETGELIRLVVFPQVQMNDPLSTTGKLLSFTIKSGEYVPGSAEASLYLSMLFLMHGDYVAASRFIQRKTMQTEALSKDERVILEWISTIESSVQDSHPIANAIRLKATAMLLIDQSDFAKRSDIAKTWVNEEKLVHSYIDYLKHRHGLNQYALSRDEERVLIRECLIEIESLNNERPIELVNRLQELNIPLTKELDEMRRYHFPDANIGNKPHFSDLSMQRIFPAKGELLDSQFFSNYQFIVNIKDKTWEEIRDFVYQMMGSSPSIASYFQPRTLLISQLLSHLQSMQKNKCDAKFISSLLLEAIATDPARFPNYWEGTSRDTFYRYLFHPLRQWIIENPDIADRFSGLPLKTSPAIKTPSIVPEVKPHVVSIDSEIGFELPKLREEFLQKKPIGDEALSSHSTTLSALSTFLTASINENIVQQNLEGLRNKTANLAKEPIPTSYALPLNSIHVQGPGICDALTQAEACATYGLHSLEIAKQSFQTVIERQEKELKLLESKILHYANKTQNAQQKVNKQARLLTGDNNEISIHGLIQQFTRTYPITDRRLKDYLFKATHIQWLKYLVRLQSNVINAIAERDKDPNAKENEKLHDEKINTAIQLLGTEWDRKPCYSIDAHPEYLVFEYYEGIRLREEQVGILDGLTIKQGIVTTPQRIGKAIELRPAAGKTSVVAPLLGWMHADGHRLAMTVMPQALIPSMMTGMQEKMGKAFNQILDLITIKSEDAKDVPALKRYYERFLAAKNDKKVVLISSESLNTLYLSMTRSMHALLVALEKNPFEVGEQREEVEIYIQIFKLFKESGCVIVDESDVIWNVLKSFHRVIDTYTLLLPTFSKPSAEIYRYVWSRPEIVESLKKQSTEYDDKHKKGIVTAILKGEIDFGNDAFNDYRLSLQSSLVSFIGPPANTRKYLEGSNDSSVMKNIAAIQNEEVKDILATCREQLNDLLSLTVVRNLYEHYGPSTAVGTDEEFLAIPYHLGKPSPAGTQHGTELEIINYTIQMYLLKGVTPHLMKKMIEKIQQTIDADLDKKVINNPSEHKLFRFFNKLGNNNYSYKDTRIETLNALSEQVNKDPNKILDVVHTFILPAIKVYPEQLDAYSQLMGTIFNQLLGMSGTLWNAGTFHQIISEIRTSATDIKTLSLLLRDPKKDSSDAMRVIPQPTELTDQSIKDMIVKSIGGNKPCSLIDAAGLFRGVKGEDVAKQLYLVAEEYQWNMKGVGFYDINDKLMVVTKKDNNWIIQELASAGISIEQLLMFWAQLQTTGSDVKLSPLMVAGVTIGRHTILRDLIQAVWRLRGLKHADMMHIIVTDKDREYIQHFLNFAIQKEWKENLLTALSSALSGLYNISLEKKSFSILDIFLYTIIQQAIRQGNDRYRSFDQKMRSIVLEKTLAIMFAAPSADEVAKIFSICKVLFETQHQTRPYLLYGNHLLQRSSDRWQSKKGHHNNEKQKRIDTEAEEFLNSPVVIAFRDEPVLKKHGYWSIIHSEITRLAQSEISMLPDFLPPKSEYNKERSVEVMQETMQETMQMQLQELDTIFDYNRDYQDSKFKVSMPETRRPWIKPKLEGVGSFFDYKLMAIMGAPKKKSYCKTDPIARYLINLSNVPEYLDNGHCTVDVITYKAHSRYVYPSISEVLGKDYPQFAAAFDPNLYCHEHLCPYRTVSHEATSSIKFLPFDTNESRTIEEAQYRNLPFIEGRVNFYKLLVVENDYGLSAMMIDSVQERDLLAKRSIGVFDIILKAGLVNNNFKVGIYDLMIGMTDHLTGFSIDENVLEESSDFQRLKMQAKFFQGEIYYSNKELMVMEKWLRSLDVEVMKDMINFFQKHILHWNRVTSHELEKSDIANLFRHLLT